MKNVRFFPLCQHVNKQLCSCIIITALTIVSSPLQANTFLLESVRETEVLNSVTQQKVKVTGRVVDSTGEPLPGAAVVIQGTPQGVTTDMDGNFSMEVDLNAKLEISYLGMEKEVLTASELQKNKVVQLKDQTDELEEVTVVAFAKQKKESVLASVSTIKPAELKAPTSNLTTALAGRVAGMISYQRSGEPGMDNADFFIRGVTTFGYSKSPLILMDGLEISSSKSGCFSELIYIFAHVITINALLKMKQLCLLIGTAVLGILLVSCSAQKRVWYLQDAQPFTPEQIAENGQIRIKPLDRLTIVVNSKDPELAVPFNSATSYNSLTGTNISGAANSQALQMRTVDENGMLEMPVIGKIECKGKTRSELAGHRQEDHRRRIYQRPHGQRTVRRHEDFGHRRSRPPGALRRHARQDLDLRRPGHGRRPDDLRYPYGRGRGPRSERRAHDRIPRPHVERPLQLAGVLHPAERRDLRQAQ